MSEQCDQKCADCSADCSERKACPDFQGANSKVRKVVGVVSGKGGVGKSLVTALLASALSKKGLKTAVLDADITGPSIPRLFGLHNMVLSNGKFIQPACTQGGIRAISMNLCLPDEQDPVVWRGPLIAGVVKQFWEEVDWGEVDCMFVDMPPGTGDVPLTVFQTLPVKGIVVVTTPQELAGMIVAKAVRMAELMHIPVLGLVENMAYYQCPDCGAQHEIFGKSRLQETAASFGISTTARIPIDPRLAALCDQGKIEDFDAGEWLGAVTDVVCGL
ncbi:MAG: Mrp/NBP35 family ATP-binding protein [Fretibacterium sp.]|nr:Mrp/NBP35 family ATP-binding protein [Fretibacterium sp.]